MNNLYLIDWFFDYKIVLCFYPLSMIVIYEFVRILIKHLNSILDVGAITKSLNTYVKHSKSYHFNIR